MQAFLFLGLVALVGGSAFAPTPAQNALRWHFCSLVRITATVVQKVETGQNTALDESAYKYCIRNYG